MTISEYRRQFSPQLKQATLCFLLKNDRVLLGLKKRGFGKNRWNGFGGKVNPDETVLQAAKRETQEESGVVPNEMKLTAKIEFYFVNRPEYAQQVFSYSCYQWQGTPVETEEMRPQWFSVNKIPYADMWPDDELWLPKVLSGQIIEAQFLFSGSDQIVDYQIGEKNFLNYD